MWKNGDQQGQGTYTDEDGNIYSGLWDKGLLVEGDNEIDISINKDKLLAAASGSGFFVSPDFFGWIIPINLSDFILSLIISRYRGSNIFKGTVVLGKIIKLLSGKTGIILEKLFIFYL